MHDDAATRILVGLVGTGVGPSLTPALHMAEARAHGLDYVYRTIDLDDLRRSPRPEIGEVLAWARTLGYDALNITHPCKQLVLEHLDADRRAAAALGAVNTVVFADGGAGTRLQHRHHRLRHRLRRGTARRARSTSVVLARRRAGRAPRSPTPCCGWAPST